MHKTSLVPPVSSQWDWQHEGLCRTRSPELFFHPDGERGAVKRAREERAKALCHECPVIEQCRAHALGVPEPYGVWGGLSEDEREQMLSTAAQRRTG